MNYTVSSGVSIFFSTLMILKYSSLLPVLDPKKDPIGETCQYSFLVDSLDNLSFQQR